MVIILFTDLISEVIKLQTSYIKNFNDAGTSPFMLIMLQGMSND